MVEKPIIIKKIFKSLPYWNIDFASFSFYKKITRGRSWKISGSKTKETESMEWGVKPFVFTEK